MKCLSTKTHKISKKLIFYLLLLHTMNSFAFLPSDLVRFIVNFMLYSTSKAVSQLRGVCKNWERALSDDALKCYDGFENVFENETGRLLMNVVGMRTKNFMSLLYDNAWVINVARMCPNIVTLNLNHCIDIGDTAIMAVARGCPDLVYLNLTCCHKITDESVVAVANMCPKLETLILGECYPITDNSIVQVARKLPKLKYLNVVWCDFLTDRSIVEVACRCPELMCLLISGCDGVTDASIHALSVGCPNLKSIGAMWCDEITDEALKELNNVSFVH